MQKRIYQVTIPKNGWRSSLIHNRLDFAIDEGFKVKQETGQDILINVYRTRPNKEGFEHINNYTI